MSPLGSRTKNMAAFCGAPFFETEPWSEGRSVVGTHPARRAPVGSDAGARSAIRKECKRSPPRHRRERKKVKLYRFALRRDDGSNALESAMSLVDPAAAWPVVGQIANDARATEGRVFVTDEDENVVIMIGVASARALLGRARKKLDSASIPPLPIAV